MQSELPLHYDVAAVRCGRDHTLALLASGSVIGWGTDGSGRVAATTPEYCSTAVAPTRPVEVRLGEPLTAIAAGYGISLGITAGHEVAVWGANAAGIGGRTQAVALATPQRIAGLAGTRAVEAGEFHFGAIDERGALATWGLDVDGALGRASGERNATPGRVGGLPPLAALALGGGAMLALGRDGALFAWGSNAAGQLGVGHLRSVGAPQRIALPPIVAIAAGASHALAVTADGALFAWGSNQKGQLGRAQPAYSTAPLAVDLPARAKAVAAGMYFSLALCDDGDVYAWGWNAHGQLGLADTVDRKEPTRIAGLTKVRAIAAGRTHAAALGADTLYGFGDNTAGQLGGTTRRPTSLVAMLALAPHGADHA